MSALGRKAFSVVKCMNVLSRRGLLFHGSITDLRKLDALRSLCLTSQRYKKEQRPQEEEYDEEEIKPPIKFTTSKASHHSWTVDRSLGSDYQRPWWKVLPVSVFCVGVLLWCVFRDETEVDQRLEEHLYKHLPELLTDVEEDDVKEENAKPIS